MINNIRRHSKRTWLIIICVMLCAPVVVAAASAPRSECAQPPPGTIFCEDFQGANPKNNFDDFDGNPDSENLVITDLGPSNDAANKVIRLRVPAGQSGTSDLIKVLPSTYDSLYLRWYFKYETGFNFNAPNHGGGMSAGNRSFVGSSGVQPDGTNFAKFYPQYQEGTAKPYAYSYYRGMYQDCGGQGSCFGDSLPCVYDNGTSYCKKPQHRPATVLPTIQADKWYCVEELITMGTPSPTGSTKNGRLALWLDGVPFGDFTDLWLRTVADLKIQNVWIALFHHDGTHSTAGQLIDNVVASTERIGCGGSDQVPPSPPTNLRIVP